MKRTTRYTQGILDQVARHKDVMQAWIDGKPIQFNCGNGWEDFPEDSEPSWLLGSDYRIKPKSPLQIPWELIDKKYQWAAKSGSGWVYLYTTVPCLGQKAFRVEGVGQCILLPLVNIDPDDIPWQDSLVKRPADPLEE
jgi:hypothetical protein